MVVAHRPTLSVEADKQVVRGVVEAAGRRHEITWKVSGASCAPIAEVTAPVALIAAMRLGEDLRIEAPISPRLLGNLDELQAIFRMWFGFKTVKVDATTRPERSPAASSGAFFSMGVDSFHTLMRHESRIDSLVTVYGFDVPLKDVERVRVMSERARAAARSLGKRLVEIETDVRGFVDTVGEWGAHTHGAAMACAAHFISPEFGRLYMAASHSYRDLVPRGSHPLLDPLWSSEEMSLIHDGVGATRFEKVAAIARHPVALEHLRVCWQNLGDSYNCCRCEKCVRTMVALLAVDALGRCKTFDRPLDVESIYVINPTPNLVCYFEENIEAIERHGGYPLVLDALRHAVALAGKPRWRRRCHALVRSVKRRLTGKEGWLIDPRAGTGLRASSDPGRPIKTC